MQLIISISTHSLTRRLTDQHSNNIRIRGYFNSQPHKEADDKPHDIYNTDTCISTHSLTRRLTAFDSPVSVAISYFNSQPHKEADACVCCLLSDLCISTHSLTRRLTEQVTAEHKVNVISTHSLTRRLTGHPTRYL